MHITPIIPCITVIPYTKVFIKNGRDKRLEAGIESFFNIYTHTQCKVEEDLGLLEFHVMIGYYGVL